MHLHHVGQPMHLSVLLQGEPAAHAYMRQGRQVPAIICLPAETPLAGAQLLEVTISNIPAFISAGYYSQLAPASSFCCQVMPQQGRNRLAVPLQAAAK